MGRQSVEPCLEVIKLPVGVLRKYTSEGMRFEGFVFPSNPHQIYGAEEVDFPYGIDFDDALNGGMDKAMEDRFNLVHGAPDYVFEYHQDDSDKVILTWTFTVTVEGVHELELIKRIMDSLGDREMFKRLVEFPDDANTDIWEIVMKIMTAMKKVFIPELIQYGHSEITYRAATPVINW